MSSLKNSEQIIDFNFIEDQNPTHICSNVIKVKPSDCTLTTKSNPSTKVTTQKVVDYLWKDRYTLGHLITYHTHTKLMAYVLAISNSYMIRVLNEESSHRCLIKDFSGEVVDIAFSKSRLPYIASIDINGWIKVNKIIINDDSIEVQLIFKIEPRKSLESIRSSNFCCSRVMWCWHNDVDMNGGEFCKSNSRSASPAETDDPAVITASKIDTEESGLPNYALLLGVIHGTSFDVIQVDSIELELQTAMIDEGKVKYNTLINREQLLKISRSLQNQYSKDVDTNLSELFLPYLYYVSGVSDDKSNSTVSNKITSFAISNDAAAFAVALQDGSVRFFTLDGSSQTGLKEEYQWKPFDNEAVWSLLFLDDCRPGNKKEAFWCHVVVGSSYNREFRLYRCDKWDCVQQITFQSSLASFLETPGSTPSSVSNNPPTKEVPCLITAHLDESAHFIIASDLRHRAIYVIELGEVDNGQTKLFKSIQEFILSQPLFSFDINTVSTMPTADGCQQIVIKLCAITKEAFLKMKVSYHTSGHRMGEIQELISQKSGFGGSTGSIVTHITSLQPSVANSLQDPAIISTASDPKYPNHLHKQNYSDNTERVCNDDESDVPETLKHLFASATANNTKTSSDSVILSGKMSAPSSAIRNGTNGMPPDISSKKPTLASSSQISSSQRQSQQSLPSESAENHGIMRGYGSDDLSDDDDDDSGDEASLQDDENEEQESRGIGSSKQPDFPIHPPPSHDYDDEEEILIVGDEADPEDLTEPALMKPHQIQQNYKIQNLSTQLELMRVQMIEVQQTLSAIYKQQQQQEVTIRENQKQSASVKPPEIILNETLLSRISHKTSTEMSDQLSGKIQSKLSQELRMQLTNVLAPVLHDTIGNNLQDKKTIQLIADSVSETTSRVTKSVLTDVIRKEFTPRLASMIDRLIEDSGRVIKEGISDVLGSLDQSSKTIQKQVSDRVMDQSKRDNSNWQAQFQKLSSDICNWKSDIQSSVNHQALAQSRIIDSLRDIKETMTNLQVAAQYDPTSSQMMQRGISMTSLLSNKAATSEHEISPELQIQRKLTAEDYVSAVTIALNQTNLPLLLSTLKKVEKPENILSKSPIKKSYLPISSVLCLIQQLSREFSDEFDLKFEFLFEAVMVLTFYRKKHDRDSLGNSVSSSNMSKVLSGMLRRLQSHLEHENTSRIKNNIRLLIGFVSSKIDDLGDSQS